MRRKSPFDTEFANEFSPDEVGPHSTPHRSRFMSGYPKQEKSDEVNLQEKQQKEKQSGDNSE